MGLLKAVRGIVPTDSTMAWSCVLYRLELEDVGRRAYDGSERQRDLLDEMTKKGQSLSKHSCIQDGKSEGVRKNE